ncbi:hypothetical protein [Paenibacillus whitsoniae]|uniref:CobB/CobQ-like glutamine amidotransferase domain-containing protein n=1 Tax=Paenibacillus whitsoniae TaxID=2496558 RepID=A0A3S0BVC9_9BACL|nr:hypothetical protein [Paenibacillus whitsoniae]RTE09189.1 hypothetical protein EJQ19_12450 [Paenibacillus whitsoniae]
MVKLPLMYDGVGCLAICGGYQLLGNYYMTSDGTPIKGLDVCEFYSEEKKNRMVGNVVVDTPDFGHLLGFENHSGRTFHQYEPLGKVIKGYGNNGEDGK